MVLVSRSSHGQDLFLLSDEAAKFGRGTSEDLIFFLEIQPE